MDQNVIHPIEKINLKCAVRTMECIFSRCRDPEVHNAAKKLIENLQTLQEMIKRKEKKS